MEIKYSKKDLKNLIEKYYLEKEERNVEVNISYKSELVGYYETRSCVTTIKVKEKVTLLGREATINETINKDQVYNILNELLENTGYILESIEYDDGIRPETVGYFMNEHTEYKPYFNGIKLNVRKNNLIKIK